MSEDHDYEPGLGCPHCSWAGYTAAERTKHISKEHPSEFAGATGEMREFAKRAGDPGLASGSEFEIFRDRRGK